MFMHNFCTFLRGRMFFGQMQKGAAELVLTRRARHGPPRQTKRTGPDANARARPLSGTVTGDQL